MPGLIGYYVHHQGRGHRDRAQAIARYAPDRFMLIGTGLNVTRGAVQCVDLDDDHPLANTASIVAPTPPCLHYAPIGHDGIRRRVATLAAWIAVARPAVMVIDVSVEIAMLARLASTPTIYLRLSGSRDDPPHIEAFRSAQGLIAPFHSDLDDATTPDWVREKTTYLPGLTPPPVHREAMPGMVLVIGGAGGAALDGTRLAAAARATPHLQWRAIGLISRPHDLPANLEIPGWITDVAPEIAGAAVVIGGAGDGLVSAVIAAGRPFICLPQPRPYDEQIHKARRLGYLGVAIVVQSWPDTDAWPNLIAQAQALDPRSMLRLHDPDGPRNAADFLMSVARGAA